MATAGVKGVSGDHITFLFPSPIFPCFFVLHSHLLPARISARPVMYTLEMKCIIADNVRCNAVT